MNTAIPHSETVNLLRRTGLPLLRTDQLGTITITSDGRTWQVVEPSLASRGHPTQADIDRIAASVDDAPASRTTRSRTAKRSSGCPTRGSGSNRTPHGTDDLVGPMR